MNVLPNTQLQISNMNMYVQRYSIYNTYMWYREHWKEKNVELNLYVR